MSKKLNLIFSILSLVTTTILLIVTVYSWYTQNEVVQVKSIVAQTENQSTNYELYYWDDKTATAEWKIVTEIKKTNVLPGTATYFRLKCTNNGSEPVTIKANFEGIESRLDTNYVKVSADGSYVTYNTVKAYDIENGNVTVDPVVVGEDSLSVLYNITNSTVALSDFIIENGYMVETFGTTETHSGAIDNIDDVTSDLKTVDELVINGHTTPAGQTNYYYFALTYLDNAELNNYFMYQILFVESLKITEI